jgi:hypothetical protein
MRGRSSLAIYLFPLCRIVCCDQDASTLSVCGSGLELIASQSMNSVAEPEWAFCPENAAEFIYW